MRRLQRVVGGQQQAAVVDAIAEAGILGSSQCEMPVEQILVQRLCEVLLGRLPQFERLLHQPFDSCERRSGTEIRSRVLAMVGDFGPETWIQTQRLLKASLEFHFTTEGGDLTWRFWVVLDGRGHCRIRFFGSLCAQEPGTK